MRGPVPSATIFVDADNTLWDTDRVFAEAQLQLLADVEQATGREAAPQRLSFLRELDQLLAERHHKGLRYPPRLLVQGLALALCGTALTKAVNAALVEGARPIDESEAAGIERRFFQSISQPPPLRPGVIAGLDALRAAGCLVLILTEGSYERVRSTAEANGLMGHFDRIIEAPKHPRLYERVKRLTGAPPRAFMVGDQLDRDIAPAKEAGLVTIYFPGGFTPRWAPNEDKVGPDYRISTFDQLVPIVLNDLRIGAEEKLASSGA
jgi:putative hydrolase of the HAD superfamily